MTEERKITFTGMTGRFDVPSFILTQNSDLRIKIDFSSLKNKSGLFSLFVIHGGAPKYTFAFTQKEPVITLSAEWLKSGGTEPVEFSMKQYNDTGTMLTCGGYVVEPLLVTEENGNFFITPFMQKLIDEVKKLRQDLTEAFESYKTQLSSEMEAFKSAVVENLEEYKNSVFSEWKREKEKTEESMSEYREAAEAFKVELVNRLSETESQTEKALSELEAERAAKEEILARLTDYLDNGAELFPEELK